jgi:two-component system response regulator QseB
VDDAAPRILVVEDDRALAGMLGDLLRSEGYVATVVHDGQSALHEGLTQEFDVMLLDRGLPVIDGLDVLARLRSRGVLTPTLILSALGNPADRVEGLDRGAEDYLTKPFDVDELLARLRALRRRLAQEVPVLRIPGGRLDPQRRTVSGQYGVVELSERECELLTLLARHPHQVFHRDELLSTIFADATETGVVDTYVHYLRRKLGRGCIATVRGVGYALGRS